ncbi:Cytochrome P450 3A28 [Coccomyxa sp. Obi]|nr:Cytochrome P450 3A28 [Coccomyxa sp. Obi]
MVVLSDAHLIDSVVGRSTELEKSVDVFYNQFNVLAHNEEKSNLFTSRTNDWWRLIRKGLSPAFSANNLRKGFPEVQQVTQRLINAMRKAKGAALALDKATLCVTLDVIGRVGFQKDFGATSNFEAVIEGKLPPPPEPKKPSLLGALWDSILVFVGAKLTPSGQAHDDFRRRMRALLEEAKARGEPKADDQSISGLLLKLKDPKTGQRLPDDRLAAEFAVVYQGGTETTSLTTAWAVFMITQHPEVEAKVLAELDALGLLVTPERPNPRPLEYDDLTKLTYTNNCIKESMRMLPVLSGTNRMSDKDIMLGGYLIPRNTMIWCNLNATMSNPAIWENPEVFLPERWEAPGAEYVPLPGAKLGAAGAAAIHVTASADAAAAAEKDEDENEHRVKRFTPFSVGPRDCIGQNLAKINYQTTVPMLLANFKFKLSDEMGGYEGVRASESMGMLPFTSRPARGLKRLWFPRLECTGMLALRPAKGFQMHCIPRDQT